MKDYQDYRDSRDYFKKNPERDYHRRSPDRDYHRKNPERNYHMRNPDKDYSFIEIPYPKERMTNISRQAGNTQGNTGKRRSRKVGQICVLRCSNTQRGILRGKVLGENTQWKNTQD